MPNILHIGKFFSGISNVGLLITDSDDEISKHLELVFEGSTVVPWPQFYFEAEGYLDAFRNLVRNTVQYPIALHGAVKSKRTVQGKSGPTNVLNLAKPKYVSDPDNPEIGLGVDASI